MLSVLWHVTAVIPVPPTNVRECQSMLNRFILGRKTLPPDRYRPLIARTWQYDRGAPLKLPHLTSKLRAQRLLLLQRLMLLGSLDSTPWRNLVQRQYARVLG
ncbi:hypothetical protein H310_03329 [Aphanomyces invadans]|uniref:Uncharacterized protein n=1 Tax=Aphanomyces invadans TaxID=157072 RepID=A0A024UHB0_9STRA|nr:hypothetical protein H310_03329 [Aphanomyces invadans]ETW05585.1 hypothetical protein H310_03329 [Aphanomyces invadans]|eukprot:XP_008865362.1 hypothetical protein H310_03329 [Aphanomyces invadans]